MENNQQVKDSQSKQNSAVSPEQSIQKPKSTSNCCSFSFKKIILFPGVLILAFVAFQFYQTKNQIPTKEISKTILSPTPIIDNSLDTSTPDEIGAGWKTYRTEEFGFSLRYPDDAIVAKRNDFISIKNHSEKLEENDRYDFIIKVIPNPKKINSREYINEYIESKKHPDCKNISPITPEHIRSSCEFSNKISDVILTSFKEYSNGSITGIIGNIDGYENPNVTVIYSEDNYIYQFTLWPGFGTGSQLKESHKKLFDQILSTFQFTK